MSGPIDELRRRLAAPRKRSRWSDAPVAADAADAAAADAAATAAVPLTTGYVEPPAPPPGTPALHTLLAVGDEVLARWSGDGLWYAARVLSTTHGGYANALYKVHYVGWVGHEEGGLCAARVALRAGDSAAALLERRRARAPPAPAPAPPPAGRARAAAAPTALESVEAAAEAAALAAAEAAAPVATAVAATSLSARADTADRRPPPPPPPPAQQLLAPALLQPMSTATGWRQRRAARDAAAPPGD